MNKRGLAIFSIVALFCASLFAGCATVPKETLEEKDAIIQNLNSQNETLKEEVNRLRASNDELTRLKNELEEKLKEKQKAAEVTPAPKMK